MENESHLGFRAVAEILTTREVARELRCSKAHVHNMINGKVAGTMPLPAITLGRRRLVRRASLNEWLRANERPLG
jgi:excisionase family DNA binding protein